MSTRVLSATPWGVDAQPVTVELDLHDGLPRFDIEGLSDAAVREGRERVRSAVRQSGFAWPLRQISVRLVPVDRPKDASALDLAIAVAILAALGQLPQAALDGHLFSGELDVDGRVRSVRGGISVAETAARPARAEYRRNGVAVEGLSIDQDVIERAVDDATPGDRGERFVATKQRQSVIETEHPGLVDQDVTTGVALDPHRYREVELGNFRWRYLPKAATVPAIDRQAAAAGSTSSISVSSRFQTAVAFHGGDDSRVTREHGTGDGSGVRTALHAQPPEASIRTSVAKPGAEHPGHGE